MTSHLYRMVAVLAALLMGPACTCSHAASGEEPVEARYARATTALAAVLEAAAQAADAETGARFRRFLIAPESWPELELAFPARVALREAVARWPDERRSAALAWVGENATWSTMLHALAIESFSDDLTPREWGPSMSRFDEGIFSRRAGLAPLLRDALADPAIRAVAESLSRPREGFDAAGVADTRGRLLRYLRLPDEYPPFAAYHAVLMAPGTGVNAELPDGTLLFVVGPSTDPAFALMVLAHEMAHRPVDRVLRHPEVVAALDESGCAFEPITERYGYDTWRSFFAEALVRSLSYRLQGVAPAAYGFAFEAELVDDLRRWEESGGGDFAETVVGMLIGIHERHCRGTARPASP